MMRSSGRSTRLRQLPLAARALLTVGALLLLASCAVQTLPEGVDVLARIENAGANAWRVVGVQGGQLGNTSGDNPTLTLEVGMRYRFDIPVSNGIHPFELLSLGAGSAEDVVLLSEGANVQGSFEDDPAVDFIETDGIFEFTLTQELADALSGYRCGIHVNSMRGAIDIAP